MRANIGPEMATEGDGRAVQIELAGMPAPQRGTWFATAMSDSYRREMAAAARGDIFSERVEKQVQAALWDRAGKTREAAQ
jgi:hypothetical protein